jgi:hypothetical protein
VLFFLMHVAIRSFLRAFGGGSPVAALELENAVLRHQLTVLRRTVKQPLLRRRDRILLAAPERRSAEGALVSVPALAADARALAP